MGCHTKSSEASQATAEEDVCRLKQAWTAEDGSSLNSFLIQCFAAQMHSALPHSTWVQRLKIAVSEDHAPPTPTPKSCGCVNRLAIVKSRSTERYSLLKGIWQSLSAYVFSRLLSVSTSVDHLCGLALQEHAAWRPFVLTQIAELSKADLSRST